MTGEATTDCLACEMNDAVAIAVEDWRRRHGAPPALDVLQALAHVAGLLMAQIITLNPGAETRATHLMRERLRAGIATGSWVGSDGAFTLDGAADERDGETLQ